MDPKWYTYLPDVITQEECNLLYECFTMQEHIPVTTNWFAQHRFFAQPEMLQKTNQVVSKVVDTLGLTLKSGPQPRVFLQGDYMDWHIDYLYEKSEDIVLECILTVFNDSDSVTNFKAGSRQSQVNTQAGSLLIVTRRGVCHSVTPVTSGKRYTIKFSCTVRDTTRGLTARDKVVSGGSGGDASLRGVEDPEAL